MGDAYNGAFHGIMAAHTPMGSRLVYAIPAGIVNVSPSTLSAHPAKYIKFSRACGMFMSMESRYKMPASMASRDAMMDASLSIRSANLRSRVRRKPGLSRFHDE